MYNLTVFNLNQSFYRIDNSIKYDYPKIGDITMEKLIFKDKQEFWDWLSLNHHLSEGKLVQFDKQLKTSTLKYEESVDVALCFGWIDGVTKRIDEQFYTKYFTKRSIKSIWSTKNKKSVERLMKDGLMRPSGMEAVELAKRDGRWEKSDLPPLDFNVNDFEKLLINHQTAHEHFLKFSPSIQKTYAMSYYTLKKDDSRERRLSVIIKRLENNLKPM